MKRLTKFVAAILSLSLLAAGATACQPGNGGTTSGQEESPLKNQATYDEQQQQSIKYYPYSTLVDGDYGRLRDFVKKCQAGGEVTVAAIGGSVTQGESATEPSKNYPSLIKAWLEKTYPGLTVNMVNAGCNGTGSVIGVERAERDVLSKNPDFIIVEFSVNDGNNDLDKEAYESLMRVFLQDASHPAILHLAHTNRNNESAVDIHKEICEHYNIPLVSMQAVFEHGGYPAGMYVDSVHPNDVGFVALSNLVTMKLADVAANLDNIPDPDYTIPAPLTNSGLEDCTGTDMKNLDIADWGAWKVEGTNIVCEEAGGDPIVINLPCSYLLGKYERNDQMNGTVRIVVDDKEDEAYTINNHGAYYNVVDKLCMEQEPGTHTVKIYLIEGDRFTFSQAYLSNYPA